MAIGEMFPIVFDTEESYVQWRRRGKNREDAIKEIENEYSNELSDIDDAPQVWIGLAKALGKKKELLPEVYTEAKKAFFALKNRYPEHNKLLQLEESRTCDFSKIGPEAKYAKKRIWKPDWQIGDTFEYLLKGDISATHGLIGKKVIVRKIGENLTESGEWEQIVYLSLCENGKTPKTTEELDSLGYIPRDWAKREKKYYHYRWPILVTSPQKHRALQFTRIGTFPDAQPPRDEEISILGRIPLFPEIKEDCFKSLEFQVCYRIKNYGIIR